MKDDFSHRKYHYMSIAKKKLKIQYPGKFGFFTRFFYIITPTETFYAACKWDKRTENVYVFRV